MTATTLPPSTAMPTLRVPLGLTTVPPLDDQINFAGFAHFVSPVRAPETGRLSSRLFNMLNQVPYRGRKR